MPYSHNHHNTMVKSHNTLVKQEERHKAAQLTFQTKKKSSCICKLILVIFILAGIITSTIFLVHFLAQKLNLDQDYSKHIASKFILPSFSSLRNTDSLYSNAKDTYQEKSHTSSHDKSVPKWTQDDQTKLRNSNKKHTKPASTDSEADSGTSSRTNFTGMQFWNYFRSENSHLHPNRVLKTDISKEENTDVRLTIPQYATLKGVKLTEFGNVLYKFLSIPYAEPPIGKLRFGEPVEYKPRPDDVLDNTKFGAICPQFFDEILVKTVTPLSRNMSEDCLTLNIWTPVLPKSKHISIAEKQPNPKSDNNLWTILTEDTLDFEEENTNSTSSNNKSNRVARDFGPQENLLPVMVWIHGGGFSMGSTALDEYDGSVLASYGHVIVVTINYRLGIFGFFNLNTPDATGNQGLKDQVLALKFIKKHIRHFGGDPNRVTVMGQSAGGFAVGLHMISPNSAGLFRRAILQSGSPVVFDQFYQNTYNIAKRLVQYVDCEEKDELENPQADSSTEANTNEEETEEDGEESGDGKNEEKIHSSGTGVLKDDMKSSLEENDFRFLNRQKRDDNEEEGDDEEEEDEEKGSSTTEKSSSSLTTSSTSTTTEASTSSSSTEASSSSTSSSPVDTSTSPSSTTITTTKSEKDDSESDDDDDETENKNDESKTSTLSTEASSSSTSSSTTETPTTMPSKSTEKTFFTSPVTGSTTLSPSLNKKSSTTSSSTTNNEDEAKKATKILKCMQSKTMKTLIKAQKNAMQNSMFPFSPNKHESILPKMPAEIIKQDVSANYFHPNVEQVLLGVNKDEGSLYLHLTMPQLFPSENFTLNISRLSDLRAMLANNLTNAFKVPRPQAVIVANLLLSNGPEIDTPENLVKKYYQLIADLMFTCPTVMLADELVKLNYKNENDQSTKKKQVYFYRFNERPSVTQWGQWMGITHHEEVQFVFGMPLKYPLKYNTKDLVFSKRIMKTWSHFARTGEMLPQLDLKWPSYNSQQQLMELSLTEAKVTEKLHEKNCNLFRIGFESFMKRRKRYIK